MPPKPLRRPENLAESAAAVPEDGADVLGLGARLEALSIIEAALARRGGLDEALTSPGMGRLRPEDRAFARALAFAVLRRRGELNAILDKKLKKRPSEAVQALLRLGVVQLMDFDTPDFAAVSTTVKLADRDAATRPFKGLINGVLRGLVRSGIPAVAPKTRLPDWLWQRWSAQYGEPAAVLLATLPAMAPPTDITFKTKAVRDAFAAEHGGEAIGPDGLRVALKGDPAAWPGYADGDWWVQDAAAAAAGRALGAGPGETVLDACAAPGGKTLQLAAAGAKVTALDRSENRLKRVTENLARAKLDAEVIAVVAEDWQDDRQFDAVLLDAPCSATGAYRRQPDVLWAAKPADVVNLADVQHRLLDAVSERVRPGGRLVFCTCSLEREEGETQVLAFLRRNAAFKLEPLAAEALGAPKASERPEGWLRLLPSDREGGQDGFFVARLRRSET